MSGRVFQNAGLLDSWRKRHYILRLNLLLEGHVQTECAGNLSPYYSSYKSLLQCLKRNKSFCSAYKQNVKAKELTGTFNQMRKPWSLLDQDCPNRGTTSVNYILFLLLLLLLLIIITTAIEFSLGGSSPYTSTDKTNRNKHT